MGVQLAIFRAPNGQFALHDIESSRAQVLRVENEEAAAELVKFQLEVCAALGCGISFYEEREDDSSAVPTKKDVERRLHLAARGQLGFSMVVAPSQMTLDEAKAKIGELGTKLRLSTAGYVVFPFVAYG